MEKEETGYKKILIDDTCIIEFRQVDNSICRLQNVGYFNNKCGVQD